MEFEKDVLNEEARKRKTDYKVYKTFFNVVYDEGLVDFVVEMCKSDDNFLRKCAEIVVDSYFAEGFKSGDSKKSV